MTICKNCGRPGNEKFCPDCGEQLILERPSAKHFLEEVAHTFTHFDGGFFNTLKALALRPGYMQKQYLEGPRRKFQKPFPMFAICASFCAIALYQIYRPSHDDVQQVFYKSYYTFVQTAMLPIYAFTTRLLFYGRKFHYGESLVLLTYMLAFITILVIPVNLLQFFLPNGPVTLIELTVFAVYSIITNLNFFINQSRLIVVIKTVLNIILNFALFQVVANLVIKYFM